MLHHHFATTDSTNRRAEALAAEHPGEVVLVTAETQTTGRGRMDRRWQSPRGGAWFTLAWPCHKPAEHYETLPLVVGLAVCETIETGFGVDASGLMIKWPNDVLHGGKKLAGILCERTLANASPVPLLVGVGINVNNPTRDLPPGLRRPPVALSEITGSQHDVADLIQSIAERLHRRLYVFESDGYTPDTEHAIKQRLINEP